MLSFSRNLALYIVVFCITLGCSSQIEQSTDNSDVVDSYLESEDTPSSNNFALPPIDDKEGRAFVERCTRVMVENTSVESFEALDKCGCIYNESVNEFGGKEEFHQMLNSEENVPEYKINKYKEIRGQCYKKVDDEIRESLATKAVTNSQAQNEMSNAIKKDFIEMCVPDRLSSERNDELICACLFNKMIDEYGSNELIKIMYDDYRPEGLSDTAERLTEQCGGI